jgi:threonine dehydrogenase-like Zn-dependent dehydrogenase
MPIGDGISESKKVYKIHNLTDEEATLVEPTSCAIHGMDRLSPPVGAEALIMGAGPTGQYHNTIPISIVATHYNPIPLS